MSINWPVALGKFPLYRGDASGRNKVTITLTDDNDAPVDLTVFGTTWKCQAKGSGKTVDLTVDDSDKATGVLVVKVADADSADLPDSLAFDIQVTGGSISPLTLFSGTFAVSGEVTT